MYLILVHNIDNDYMSLYHVPEYMALLALCCCHVMPAIFHFIPGLTAMQEYIDYIRQENFEFNFRA